MTKYVFALLLLFAIIVSCNKKDCPSDSGVVTEFSPELSFFNQVNVYDNINIVITYDSLQKVTVEAGKNLLPGLSYEIKNNVLSLRNNNRCTWLRGLSEKITVHIHSPVLSHIQAEGSGDIRSANMIVSDHFIVDTYYAAGIIELNMQSKHTELIIRNENADILMHGQSDTCYAYIGQKGMMDLSDFSVNRLEIDHRSIRDSRVRSNDLLNAKLQWSGNVYYTGSPAVLKYEHYRSGQLIKY